MYWGIGILLLLSLFFGAWFIICRKRAFRKVCCMDECRRLSTVNELLEPFGFICNRCGCLVQTTLDAWQREFGYCRAFDRSAVGFHMVFDSEPVYFYYKGQTWLIEFWKGQYGINVGGEVGVYHADGVIPEKNLSGTVFESASDEELFPLKIRMRYRDEIVFEAEEKHWWLTGFLVGVYCEPQELVMETFVMFPDIEMQEAFVEGLRRRGYAPEEINLCGRRVSFVFDRPKSGQYHGFFPWSRRWAQWKNRQFCRLYTIVTRPFTCTVDQILYLYFFLPRIFRRMMGFRRNPRQKPGRRCCRWEKK